MSAKTRRAEGLVRARKTIAKIDKATKGIEIEDEETRLLNQICGRHTKQRAFVKAAVVCGARVCVCGGRQSGKSQGAFGACRIVLERTPDAQGLWIGLSAEAVKTTTWPSIKRYLRQWGLLDNKAPDAPPQVKITESPATITWPNNSRLTLLGTDDRRHIETFRGGTNAIVVLDECGSQPYELIQELVEDICLPSLVVSDGPFIALGTPARKRTGWFAEIWHTRKSYKKFSFNGFDNPAIPDFNKTLAKVAEDRGIEDWRTDARILREWIGEWAEDSTNAVLPNFSQRINLYTPAAIVDPITGAERPTHVVHPNGFHLLKGASGPLGLPDGTWFYSMAIDGGQRDRLAIEVMAWCDSDPRIWEVASYVAPKGAKSPPSVWVPFVRQMLALFGSMPIYLDQSGVSVSTLQIDYHLPTTEAATKQDREDQITRFNDLCAKGLIQIVEGFALAEDCIKAEWLPSRGVGTRREYSPSHKVDPLDAARYAMDAYWTVFKPADTRTDNEKARDESRKRIADLVEAARNPMEAGIVDFTTVSEW